jgi:hypothetical protein
VNETSTASAVRRINVGRAQAIGDIDNERLSSRTCATATVLSGRLVAVDPDARFSTGAAAHARLLRACCGAVGE